MKILKQLLIMTFAMSFIFISCNDDEELLPPTLGDTQVKYVRQNSVVIHFTVTDDGDEYVRDKGICYSTEPSPTLDANIIEPESSGDPLMVEIEDLDSETTYYARAYATSDAGTSYSTEVTFTTTSPVTDNDGNEYKTVKIGDQLWMAENLRTTTYNDGSAIPNITGEDAWSEATTPAYSWWENDASESDRGAYYNYYTVMTEKLCPTGWHIPDTTEWGVLLDFVGDEPGRKLKSHGEQMFTDYNETGFSAYMEGYRASGSGTFGRSGEWTFMWIGGDPLSIEGYTEAIEFLHDSHGVEQDMNSKQMGFSVRCIKD